VESERELDRVLVKRAIEALRRLESVVFVYESQASFEEGGRKLARTSLEGFTGELHKVSQAVKRILIWLPQSRCRNEIRNEIRAGNIRFTASRADSQNDVSVSEIIGRPHPST
jgi:hypothetical protein